MYVVVLDDGETFSGIEGCKILQVSDHMHEDDIEEYIKDNYESGRAVRIPGTPTVVQAPPPTGEDYKKWKATR